jgi:6-O-methylguanine DNA methyltransferase, DNA binding domain
MHSVHSAVVCELHAPCSERLHMHRPSVTDDTFAYDGISMLCWSICYPHVQALRRNPYAPEVPCHRIVAASLDIGGFMGVTGTQTPTVLMSSLSMHANCTAKCTAMPNCTTVFLLLSVS